MMAIILEYFSWLTISNMNTMFSLGSKKRLEVEDLGKIRDDDCVKSVSAIFESEWKKELLLIPPKRSLWRPIFKVTGYLNPIMGLIFQGVSSGCGFGPPLLLKELAFHVSGLPHYQLSLEKLWLYITLLLVLPIIGVIFGAQASIIFARMGCITKSSILPAMYKKSLSISSDSKLNYSSGKIINIFGNDILHLQNFLQNFAEPLFGIPQLVAALALIGREVGIAVIPGVATVFTILPILMISFVFFMKFRNQKLKYGDYRIKLISEALNGIRVLKLYAWEDAFIEKIGKIREQEVYYLGRMNYLIVIFVLCIAGCPTAMPVIIFYTYIATGSQLDGAKSFTVLALLALIQNPMYMIPMLLQQYMMAAISTKRILDFLQCDDLVDYIDDVADEDKENFRIIIKKASFSWISSENKIIENEIKDKGYERIKNEDNIELTGKRKEIDEHQNNRSINTLVNINLSFEKGKCYCVIGPVGSGKSSLLSAILGNLILKSGSIQVSGSIAYHEQAPWITNSTIKENILSGLPLDEARLNEAILGANLIPDLAIFPSGIETEIGERGINLSGGQKARVSFARALYRNADTYILDDPLSAVDGHVGEHLFNYGIKKVLKEKTVVLVTHQVHLLDKDDIIIIIDEGLIVATGTLDDIKQLGIDLTKYIVSHIDKDEADERSIKKTEEIVDDEKTGASKNNDKDSLIKEEERNDGVVSISVYNWFIKLGSYKLFIFLLIIATAATGTSSYSSFYLSDWGKETFIRSYFGNPLSKSENIFFLNRYAVLIMMGLIGVFLRSFFMVTHGIIASKKMHQVLLENVLKSPISFFDVTPIGRILNRFSTDIIQTDEGLAYSMGFVIGLILGILSYVGNIVYTTKGTFLVLLFPVSIIYYRIQLFFRKTNTDLKRLENTTRSPIYVEFNEALAGSSSLRAHKAQGEYIERLNGYVDINTNVWMLQNFCKWWLAVRLDTLGGIISFFIAALAVSTDNVIPPQYLALSLQNAFATTGMLKTLINMLAQVETMMASIERIKYYSETIEIEENYDDLIEDPEFVKSWPNAGVIKGEQVSMRYRDGPLVLHQINFDLKSHEKIGIVGRTGSGKSSLILSLFRCEKLSQGQIFIDGIDISSINIKTLRSRLGIIPQTPVMFSLSLRFNLDPFDYYTDDQLWQVLEQVEMKGSIASLPNKLQEIVQEGGANFSAGQRQLICIARVLLRNPCILVLDEATASIDSNTDIKIQKTIRNCFCNSTVLTIAHRINTIIDSDKILVLDHGRVIEFGPPHELLKIDKGIFKSLYETQN